MDKINDFNKDTIKQMKTMLDIIKIIETNLKNDCTKYINDSEELLHKANESTNLYKKIIDNIMN